MKLKKQKIVGRKAKMAPRNFVGRGIVINLVRPFIRQTLIGLHLSEAFRFRFRTFENFSVFEPNPNRAAVPKIPADHHKNHNKRSPLPSLPTPISRETASVLFSNTLSMSAQETSLISFLRL